MKRNYKMFIEDILESFEKIERYVHQFQYNDFENDGLVVDAVIRNLEIIGEAAKNVPESIRLSHSEIPWNRMIGLRNLAIHEYFGLDLSIVWEIVSKNLPETKQMVIELLKKV